MHLYEDKVEVSEIVLQQLHVLRTIKEVYSSTLAVFGYVKASDEYMLKLCGKKVQLVEPVVSGYTGLV